MSERVPRRGPASSPIRNRDDVDALLRRFEFGDAVLRHVDLDLPAAGRASARLLLEVQERSDDWQWTRIEFLVQGLTRFRSTEGPASHQVLTGPPVIAQTADGTWIVDLARDQEVSAPPTGRWEDSPHFVRGDDLSWRYGEETTSPRHRPGTDVTTAGR